MINSELRASKVFAFALRYHEASGSVSFSGHRSAEF